MINCELSYSLIKNKNKNEKKYTDKLTWEIHIHTEDHLYPVRVTLLIFNTMTSNQQLQK